MGLKRSSIIKAVSAAFKALGDIPQTITYRRTVSAYNPSTGGMLKTNTDYTVVGIGVGFSSFEVDRIVVLATDTKMVLQTKDMPVTPVIATDTVIAEGKTYNIIRWINDPSGSVITLHLRAP